MIRFNLGSFWWLIAIPMLLLFVFVLDRIHRIYTMPVFLELSEVLSRIKSDKKGIAYCTVMVIIIIVYIFLFLYCIAFIAQLTLEAELSWIGVSIFLLYILYSIAINKLFIYTKKKLNE